MSDIQTPAILIRRVEYGDYDYIITYFTLEKGRVTAIAKNAKKSMKRFAGVLELFSCMEILCRTGKRGGIPVLVETDLDDAFSHIRLDFKKTAYASAWVEIVNLWLEDDLKQESLFFLLKYVLGLLDSGHIPPAELGILFLVKFLEYAGVFPNITSCNVCGADMDEIHQPRVLFDMESGGVICGDCGGAPGRFMRVSRGVLKQLLWVRQGDMKQASRVRFSKKAENEALKFLESMVSHQLEREPKSFRFLRSIRRDM